MTRTHRAAATIAVALTLTGCGNADGVDGHGLGPRTIDLPDNRKVICVVFDGPQEAAIDCDWENAR